MEKRLMSLQKQIFFPLGIIFHEIITGELPKSCNPDFPYIGIALGRGIKIELNHEMAVEYSALIEKMLRLEPPQRPDATEVFRILKTINPLELNYRR